MRLNDGRSSGEEAVVVVVLRIGLLVVVVLTLVVGLAVVVVLVLAVVSVEEVLNLLVGQHTIGSNPLYPHIEDGAIPASKSL